MSDKRHDGGRAFPVHRIDRHDDGEIFITTHHLGMSLLDYFAAKAMQGLLACDSAELGLSTFGDVAREAYKHSEFMLKERNRISAAESGADND